MTDHRLSVHLLTGFLGSGKTTLLNNLLNTHALRDSAVIVMASALVPRTMSAPLSILRWFPTLRSEGPYSSSAAGMIARVTRTRPSWSDAYWLASRSRLPSEVR